MLRLRRRKPGKPRHQDLVHVALQANVRTSFDEWLSPIEQTPQAHGRGAYAALGERHRSHAQTYDPACSRMCRRIRWRG